MTNQKAGRLLVVDDDRDVLQAAKLYLKQQLAHIDTESNPAAIPKRLSDTEYDVILLDMNFTEDVSSGKEGFKWLQKIQEIDASVAVVLITAYGNVEKAVKAVKMGATDFVLKPWKNEKLLATINSAMKLAESRRETHSLRSCQKQISAQIDRHYQDMVGQSEVKNAYLKPSKKSLKRRQMC